MPTTIKQLVEECKLLSSTDIKEVKWNKAIDCKEEEEGIYIISLSERADVNQNVTEFPISMTILENWIKKLDYFTIDGEVTRDANKIRKRLEEFWIPDENILYIGKAPKRKKGGGIGKRIKEYYKTAIGERSPHAGGHWIKLLENLNELHVFYITCKNSGNIEKDMLSRFGEMVSEDVKKALAKKGPILPFANLEDGDQIRKKHGLGHMKKERKKERKRKKAVKNTPLRRSGFA